MAAIFALLPKDIQNEVNEYNVEHRPMMKHVCEELFLTHHRNALNEVHNELMYEYDDNRFSELPFIYDLYDTYCDGYDCGNQYNDDFEYKQYECLCSTYKFCCGYCQWEVTYDIRKSYRRSVRASVLAQT